MAGTIWCRVAGGSTTNQSKSYNSKSTASSRRPAVAAGVAGQSSWLKRIQQALSLANVIAIAAVVVALPACLLAWHQLVHERSVSITHARKVDAKKRVHNAPAKSDVRASSSVSGTTIAPVVARVEGNDPKGRTVIVHQSSFDEREAELSRPNLILDGASVQDIGLNQTTKWLITMTNEGRPANVSVMNTQELSSLDGPRNTLSCAETEKSGTTVKFGKKPALFCMAGRQSAKVIGTPTTMVSP